MAAYREEWFEVFESDEPNGLAEQYPALRAALAPDYADLAPEAIEALVESMYPDISAEDLENFFKSLRRAGQSVGRIAQRALPGVIQGATQGAALGPWGALAGGIAGGALSATRRRGQSAGPRRTGPALPGLPTRLPGRGTLAQLAGSPAAAQLLRTLGRPQVGQALMSLALGGAGRGNVRVGNVNIPTGAITNTLRRLLERSEAELHENTAGEATGTPLYLLDDAGEFLVDPTDEDQRADLVLELFALSDHTAIAEAATVEVDYGEDDEAWWQDGYAEDDDAEDEEDFAVLLYEGVDFESLDEDELD